MQTFISYETAREAVLSSVGRQPAERVSLSEALGRTLAEPVRSDADIPPFDNAAMDGYAVRVTDLAQLPARLRVVEKIPAGRMPERSVEAGACARIMTGAPFPAGADAVAPVEWTETGPDGMVMFRQAPTPGQYVRPAGKDVRKGQVVFEPGRVVTPPVVGMLAALGYAEVSVAAAPCVAVIATGDELVDAAEIPGPGQIRNANGPALAAQAAQAGGKALLPPAARDNEAAVRQAIENALEQADMLLFSGGVSVGAHDCVRQVLEARGARFLFWKVRQRPGKPLAFGMLEGKPVFGLPGNPVSSAVCFEQYVRPALAVMLGRTHVLPPLIPAVLETAISKAAGLHHFVRAQASFSREGTLQVRPTGPQDSNLYASMVAANCILHLPEALENPQAGSAVEIAWLDWR